MLNRIITFSLNNKFFILTAAVILMLAGGYCARQTDIDVFPDLTAPTVVIMTDAHGMAPEEVERLVTFPIETAVNGATNVRRVRSASMLGFSFVWTEFDWGMDVFKARQIVSEKMTTLNDVLPENLIPVLAPQSSVMGEILFIGLQADSTSMMDLRTLAEWTIKPAILATGGVSQVTIIGGDYKQYQLLADPIKMKAFAISMEELEQAGRNFSNNSSGNVIRDYGNEYVLRGIARTSDTLELGKSLIKKQNGIPITVADVAQVTIGSAIKQGYASQNAAPAVILSISKQPNINTLKVTEQIEKNLDAIRKTLPPDVVMDSRIFRQADFIEAAVGNVGNALLEGAICVIVILFLFLGSFRTTLISIFTIPLSLLGTMLILHLTGMSINTMTLGGMCIAIGSLVDDAIIDVENVYKRLRKNHSLPQTQRQKIFDVVFDASSEIRSSIIHATLIIMISFLPLFFLSGMEGRMLKPLGIAYLISLFMSMLTAMTITPLLCKLLLTDEKYLSRQEKEASLSLRLKNWYSSSLKWALAHGRWVLYPVLGLLVLAVVFFFRMGSSFLPDFNEGSLTISAVATPGISLDENNRLGNMIEKELLSLPEVSSTARRSGRGELDEHSQATNSAEIDVRFQLNGKEKDVFFNEVRQKLAAVPGISATVGQPLGHRIDHMLSGTRAGIAIKLFGPDLSRLYMIGNQVKATIQSIEGLVDLSVEQQRETPQLQIRAKRESLARHGITIEAFNHFVEMAFSGGQIAEIYEGQRSFPLVLRLNNNYTETIEQVKTALIDADNGMKVPLEEVADIVSVGGPNTISRENIQRKIVVSANVSGRDMQSVVDEIRSMVDQNISLPEGYRIEYGGQFENARKASRILVGSSLLAILIIFLLLYGEFKDFKLSGIILLNLPLALIGGIFAIFFSSGIISIPSIIGLITLFGIATRNGILLISKYQHLQKENVFSSTDPLADKQTGESSYSSVKDRETRLINSILSGSADRFNPIIMTALTSALALIPMILHGDLSGNEIQSPMAVVVLGGLISSTLLNLYVVPIVYSFFQHKKHETI